ncbi:hypothetical protein AB6O49_33515 [Streptomyces sp. SBR177]
MPAKPSRRAFDGLLAVALAALLALLGATATGPPDDGGPRAGAAPPPRPQATGAPNPYEILPAHENETGTPRAEARTRRPPGRPGPPPGPAGATPPPCATPPTRDADPLHRPRTDITDLQVFRC